MDFLLIQILNSLVYGMLLFLLSAGLSLIFGLLGVVNLAHGSFFMLGGFFALSVIRYTGSFWWALLLAPLPVVVGTHPTGQLLAQRADLRFVHGFLPSAVASP